MADNEKHQPFVNGEETVEKPSEQSSTENSNRKLGNVYPNKYKYGFWFLFFFMGVINNLGSVLILTGSQRLAGEMGMGNYMGFYTM